MQQLTIRMPEAHLAKIDQMARKMGLKRSDLTRMAIKTFIDAHSGETEKETPYQKTKDLLGVTESGISNLGQNHRQYLVQKIKKTHA